MPGSHSFAKGSLPRWNTTFGRWVREVGVMQIVSTLKPDPDLRVTDKSVYSWVAGHPPRPARAQALVDMSHGNLSLETIYGHPQEIRELQERDSEQAGSHRDP